MTRRTGRWDVVLCVVLGAVAAYALALVVTGLTVADEVFDRLGFGPDDGGIVSSAGRDHLRLVYGVLGAVIFGWVVALAALVVGPLGRREAWAWWAIVGAVTSWFVLDTGLSLVLGFAGHAAFNVVFAVALALPLWAIRRELRPGTGLGGGRL